MPFTFGSYWVSDKDALVAVLNSDEACLDIYDLGGASTSNRVDAIDIGRLVASQMVGMKQSAAAEMVRASASAPWSAVPVDARLENAAPGSQLYLNACSLFDHFTAIKDVGPAITSKMLAMKRPALFPVIDSRIEKLYRVAKRQQKGVSHPVFASIRIDALRPTDVVALSRLRARLVGRRGKKAQKLAQLSDIRLRDIVVWQRWTDLRIDEQPVAASPWPGTCELVAQ